MILAILFALIILLIVYYSMNTRYIMVKNRLKN